MALKLLILFAFTFSLARAKLSIVRGRVSSNGVQVNPVEGVVALAIGGTQDSQYLDCSGTNVTISNLQWRKENGQLNFMVSQRSRALRLDMSMATYADEGVYTCTDTSSEMSVSVNVTGASLAICPAEPMYSVPQGSTAYLRVFTSGIPAVTASEIMWFDPRNKRIPTSSRMSLVESNRALRITNVGLEDNGLYMISINRRIFGNSYLNISTIITLNIQVPPSVESDPMEMTIQEHEDVTLTCVFSGSPRPTITWDKEGASTPAMARTNTKYSETRNDTTGVYTVESRYTIMDVFIMDAGRYRCVADNEISSPVYSNYAQLDITARLQLTAMIGSTQPTIPESRLLSIANNTAVTIACRGSGKLRWSSSEGVSIPDFMSGSQPIYQRHDIAASTQELTIARFGPAYQSEYTCTNSMFPDISESILLASSLSVYILEPTVYTSPFSTTNITAVFFIPDGATFTITWFFNGMQIDTAGSAQYSTSRGENSEILQVANVGSGDLGHYTVKVSSDRGNQSDTVILAYPEPPTSSVTPSDMSVNEGGRATFTCMAGGTLTTQRWVRRTGGNVEVLSGMQQLILTDVTRSDAGNYICEVFGQYGGVNTSTVTLYVNYPPSVILTDDSTMASSRQALDVSRLDGDQEATFSCSSDGFPLPAITWSKEGGLPSGVTSSNSGLVQTLKWNRNLEFSDSGTYICTSQNSLNTSVATLNLLVTRAPVVTSIFPTFPVESTSGSSFSVPNGHSGNILTCSGLAWPPPQIEWRRGNASLTGGHVSAVGQDPYVSAKLALPQGDAFGEEDIGNYTCIVFGQNGVNDVHEEVVSLTLNTGIAPTNNSPAECAVNTANVRFQLRVLQVVDCSDNVLSNSEAIARETQTELLNVVSAECTSCSVTADSVSVSVMPSCSKAMPGAILFTGSISTESLEMTELVFCALDRWVQSSPLIRVSGSLHKVDDSCLLGSEGGSSMECILATTTTEQDVTIVLSMTVLIAICAGGGGALLLCLAIVVVVCICCCYSHRRKIGNMELKRTGPYERTSHTMDRSRYTTQVNPENPDQLDSGSPPPVYSTLDRSMIDSHTSYMQTRPRNDSILTEDEMEMQPFRRESEQQLISSGSLGNGRMFQVVSSSGSVPQPQPYQEAVSSMENLDRVGVAPPSGYNTTITTGRTSSDSNTSSSQRTSSVFMDQTPPLGRADRHMAQTHAPISITNHLATRRGLSETSSVSSPTGKIPEYEVITTRANTSHASSSPRLHMPSGRVTSAGTTRAPPAGPIRRYRSAAVEGEAPGIYAPYDEEDYENLEDQPASAGPHTAGVRNFSGQQTRMAEGGAWSRGPVATRGRMPTHPTTATSMSTAAISSIHHRPASRKVSLPEKRVSVTSYSRGSPVDPRTSLSSSINKLPLSPTKQMSPPSYRDAILCDSSMIENEAYQTADAAARQVHVQHQLVRSPNSGQDGVQKTDKFWYRNSTTSSNEDISVPREPKTTSRLSLTPYSQVSNLEIDARRAEELPRNYRHQPEPAPYAEPVSSVEELTKVGRQRHPSMPKMVLV